MLSKMLIKKTYVLLLSLCILLPTVVFPGNSSFIFADPLIMEDLSQPDVLTKKERALRIIKIGTIITVIGASCCAFSIYHLNHTPSEVFPTYAVGGGVVGLSISSIGITVSVTGIAKLSKEYRRKKCEVKK